MASFASELEKIAVNLRVVHGTNKALTEILPRHRLGLGPTFANDPNPSRVYVALKRMVGPKSKKQVNVASFAHEAKNARGGEPTILHARVNTKKGWTPISLTEWGRKQGYDLDDLRDMIEQLNDPAVKGRERADLWRTLNLSTGAIGNPDFDATVKVRKSQLLRSR